MRVYNLVGHKFGRLTVVEFAGSKLCGTQLKKFWKCICICGKYTHVITTSLLNGNTQSCGCFKLEQQRNLKIKYRKRPYEALYNSSCNHAVRAHHSINLSYEEFLKFTKQLVCHYCGDSVQWTKYNLNEQSNASNLDRKDNSLGYSVDNCVVCCDVCNRSKRDKYSYEEWFVMSQALCKFRKDNNIFS